MRTYARVSVSLAFLFSLLLSANNCRMSERSQNETSRAINSPDERRANSNVNSPRAIHDRAVVIDMHADTVQRLVDSDANLNEQLDEGHLDAVRMRAGGLDAQFFAVWVEPQFYGTGGQRAIERAEQQIRAIHRLVSSRPDLWELATSAEDIRRIAGAGRLAALLGLEGGYAIDNRLEMVEHFYRMGVRYMSPTWTVSTSWAGSSGDAAGQSRGLDEFGRGVVREMNRLGMLIDVSHVSDPTFWDIVETSSKPVIATHSGARSLVNHPRNLTDDQLRALARTGGVACVVFYPAFIERGWDERKNQVDREIAALVEAASREAIARGATPSQARAARDRVREREYLRRLPPVSLLRVCDHIDHVVRVAGIDAVGLGSDFDGIQAVPRDLASVADFPNLTAELLRRGYSEEDILKILGGNVLRVLEAQRN